MSKDFKKRTLRFYLYLAGAVLAVAGVIFSVISSSDAYKISSISLVIGAGLAAALLNLLLMYSGLKGKGRIYLDIIRLASVVLLCVCAAIIFYYRSELIGFIYFSDLESGNPVAVAAMNNAIIACVIYAVAMVTNVIAAFCRDEEALKVTSL